VQFRKNNFFNKKLIEKITINGGKVHLLCFSTLYTYIYIYIYIHKNFITFIILYTQSGLVFEQPNLNKKLITSKKKERFR